MTATVFITTFGDTVVEEYRMRDLKKAFGEVLDHPDAAEALSHPRWRRCLTKRGLSLDTPPQLAPDGGS